MHILSTNDIESIPAASASLTSRRARPWLLNAGLGILAAWAVLRLFTGIWVTLVARFVPITPREQGIAFWPPSSPLGAWLERVTLAPWHRWDTKYYLWIVERGYRIDDGTAQFHPLYPWLATPLALIGASPLLALMIVSSVAGAAFVLVFERLARLDLAPDQARWSALLLLFSPFAFALWAPYTEALFLLCAATCLLLARRGHWWWAGSGRRASGAGAPAGCVPDLTARRRTMDCDRWGLATVAGGVAALAWPWASTGRLAGVAHLPSGHAQRRVAQLERPTGAHLFAADLAKLVDGRTAPGISAALASVVARPIDVLARARNITRSRPRARCRVRCANRCRMASAALELPHLCAGDRVCQLRLPYRSLLPIHGFAAPPAAGLSSLYRTWRSYGRATLAHGSDRQRLCGVAVCTNAVHGRGMDALR